MGRQDNGNIDPTLRALGSLGRYQMMQIAIISLSTIGSAYQLLGNIFIGRHVTSYQCAGPGNDSSQATELSALIFNSSHVTYGQCEITVSNDNFSSDAQQYPCVYGYDYEFRRDLSFRTEFDLVCDRKLLGGLAQTFVIMGQGIGAVIASAFSDRFGRKMVLVLSQLGLLTFGVAVGFAPSFSVLAVLKFMLGALQQGVVTTSVTMSLEMFPAEYRSLKTLIGSTFWGVCSASLALLAYLMQDYNWRHLQFLLSAMSLVAVGQWWYVDESLRWLVANGKKEATLKVLKRAARTNRVDLDHVIKTLEASTTHEEMETLTNGDQHQDKDLPTQVTSIPEVDEELLHTLEEKQTKKLTLLDLFRNRRLLRNAALMWFAWFTCAFTFFALYMMSTSLHGDRFLNYFLTALMELPPSILFYLVVDRVGRKWATRPFFALAGLGLLCSGIFRMYAENTAMRTLSVVSAMLGMVGASGMFGAIFFFTPELFPTNMRTQALGVASLAGRCGGMIAPFMNNLADIAVWAPGALISSLCFLVVVVISFLPETKGRELPNTVEDIELWYQAEEEKGDGNSTVTK
ncbi:organic cation transporter-like protein [Littorina saxatilis]|uniref:Major facilitator superfamily (MFS) profile domain-containing protein n=1 Tax=Littorina saxatilis TaxID=31220 RepID=A0AAN9C272_9CAEN